MSEKHPETLHLAKWLEAGGWPSYVPKKAAAELRRQHARIAELEAQLEAVGAGGVSALMPGAAPADWQLALGWRPIETAPEDGASKLFRVDDFCVQGFTDATGVLCAQNDRQPWRKMRGKPTHWMPLPQAPAAPKPPVSG